MIMIGKGGRLVLQYLSRPTVNIKKDVPFYEDFNYTMSNEICTGFADAMSRAMATRRRFWSRQAPGRSPRGSCFCRNAGNPYGIWKKNDLGPVTPTLQVGSRRTAQYF